MAAKIREMRESDMDQILKIWLSASTKAHPFVSQKFWESKLPDMRNLYLPIAETYTYIENDHIKGFLSLNNNTVEALFVSPRYQGQGIGGRLIMAAKAMRNCLNLSVYMKNKRSIQFYIKHGFVIDSERVDDQTGEPELVMTFSELKTKHKDPVIPSPFLCSN